MREPLRNTDKNFAQFKAQYVFPAIDRIKSFFSSDDTFALDSVNNVDTKSIEASSSQSTVQGKTTELFSLGTLPDFNSNIKPIVSPNTVTNTADNSRLSISGILTETNNARAKSQLPKLALDATLNKAAEAKLEDMFSNQYFQHVSPSGVNVSDLIRKAGYDYIVVGENLALGNFGGDIQIVTAWMNSPGHRANILDPRFQDIGIAVGRGMYQGKEQWIAVQHFAKPLSSCKSPNPELKDKIAQHTSLLSSLESELTELKEQIDHTQSNGATYTSTVETYNLKATDYNNRLEGLKDEINTYNQQVRVFNLCAGLNK